jgi:hypothetical protein
VATIVECIVHMDLKLHVPLMIRAPAGQSGGSMGSKRKRFKAPRLLYWFDEGILDD